MCRLSIGILCLLACATASAQDDDGFVDLVQKRSLEGWVQKGGKAKYRVENGEVIGTAVPDTPNSFLCTVNEYRDFVFEFEFKVAPKLNSGIQFRSQCFDEAQDVEIDGKTKKIPAGRVHGYQYEIDPSERAFSAGIYDEGRRGWLVDLEANEMARKAFKQGAWNSGRIECKGARIKTWINGVEAATLTDAMTQQGFIALQVHSIGKNGQPGDEVRWRKLRIKELPASADK